MPSQGRIVAVPFPAVGHITPMMQLCGFLARKGFSITVAAISAGPFDALDLISSNPGWLADELDISVEKVVSSAQFPYSALSAENQVDLTAVMIYTGVFLEPLEKLMAGLPDLDRLCCMISDYGFVWSPQVAAKFPGCLSGFLYAASATSFWFEVNAAALTAAGVFPTQQGGEELDEENDTVVLNNHLQLRKSEIPWFYWNNKKCQEYTAEHGSLMLRKVSFTIINTCNRLEGAVVDSINKEIGNSLIPAGPLCLLNQSDVVDCDTECLKWLDQQPPSSVIYISFGSNAVMPPDQLDEFIAGLEASKQRFLWVIRSETSTQASEVCDAFLDRNRGLGMAVAWAPQAQVLAHASVGSFLSHCGWNSVVEAASSGKPILCWPLLFEQNTNSVLLTDKLKVATRFRSSDGVVGRGEVEQVLRLVMESQEGKELKVRAEKLREEIKSGVSFSELEDLIKLFVKE